jgi:O-antigen/teichoic acid export membrane protein
VTSRQEVLQDHEIARRATRGAATYVLRTGASQGVQTISALAVARILVPQDYGLFALALTLVAGVRVLGDLGITFSMVVRREISDSDLRIGVAVALIVAAVGGIILSVVWTQLGLVQRAGGSAIWLGPALATTLLIAVPGYPSTIVIERALKFSTLGVLGVIASVALFGTQVILLFAGLGVWSMVIAQIVGTTVGTCLTVRASGKLFLPTLRGPVLRLVRDGLPFGGGLWATSLTGTATNLIVAAQLGARGIGFFAWCTILATPLAGVLAAVHSVSVPTLARMRRDDGTRYDESVGVVMRTMATTAAVAAGCLIGLASPTIRFVFGPRWLPATGAVQFCLFGMIPAAILAVLASDANARLLRRRTLASGLTGGVATLAVIWPLSAVDGVAGASAAANCVGPIAAIAVFVWGMPVSVTAPALRSLRLFIPLLAISILLGHLVHTPLEFAAACAVAGATGVVAAYLTEGELMKLIVRMMRSRGTPQPIIDTSAGVVAP